MRAFRNPRTGRIISLRRSGFWAGTFGPLYFAKHRLWAEAVICACLGYAVAAAFARLGGPPPSVADAIGYLQADNPDVALSEAVTGIRSAAWILGGLWLYGSALWIGTPRFLEWRLPRLGFQEVSSLPDRERSGS